MEKEAAFRSTRRETARTGVEYFILKLLWIKFDVVSKRSVVCDYYFDSFTSSVYPCVVVLVCLSLRLTEFLLRVEVMWRLTSDDEAISRLG